MKKKINVFSIVSLIISIIATGMFCMLLGKVSKHFYIPWIALGTISFFFPLISKYFRKRTGTDGKALEIIALVLGFYNFWWVLSVLTQLNAFFILIVCVLPCILYVTLFNQVAFFPKVTNTENHIDNLSDAPFHKKTRFQNIRTFLIKAIKFIICVIFIPLSIIVSELLLMLLLGDSIEGIFALILVLVVAGLIFTLLYFLFIGRNSIWTIFKKKKINYEEINSSVLARKEVKKGNLEIMYILSPMFGGSTKEDNILYVPKRVNKIKKRYDNMVANLLNKGKIQSYNCRPEYKGESFIPCKITITSCKNGNIVFQKTINIW